MNVSSGYQNFGGSRFWTEEEDQCVKNAISNMTFFPEDPYTDNPHDSTPFATLKSVLTGLDRTTKQIRERWVTHLCPKLKNPTILKEDQVLVMRVYHNWQSNRQNHKTQWAEIARKIYEYFGKECYYSDNSIKNFCMRTDKTRPQKNKKRRKKINTLTKESCFVSQSGQANKKVKKEQPKEIDQGARNPVQTPIKRAATFSDPSTINVEYIGEEFDVSFFGEFDDTSFDDLLLGDDESLIYCHNENCNEK